MVVNTYVLNLSETGALIGAGINSIARKTLTITLFFIGASLSRDVLKAVGINRWCRVYCFGWLSVAARWPISIGFDIRL